MNRLYTTKDYKEVVEYLRKHIPDVSITTDIIVGFPGETDEEFNKTYEFLRDIKLTKMHIFKFSPRKGTRAAEMKAQIDGDTKEQRSSKLIVLSSLNEAEFMQKFVGRTMDVLYEHLNDKETNKYEGHTQNYVKVITEYNRDVEGQILNTKIIDSNEEFIIGKID
jgi:threonylcarbamoyladenosine tRNA methylthiotransferase MtaB